MPLDDLLRSAAMPIYESNGHVLDHEETMTEEAFPPFPVEALPPVIRQFAAAQGPGASCGD